MKVYELLVPHSENSKYNKGQSNFLKTQKL